MVSVHIHAMPSQHVGHRRKGFDRRSTDFKNTKCLFYVDPKRKMPIKTLSVWFNGEKWLSKC